MEEPCKTMQAGTVSLLWRPFSPASKTLQQQAGVPLLARDVPSHPWEPPFALTSLQEGHFGDVKPYKRGGIKDVPMAFWAKYRGCRSQAGYSEAGVLALGSLTKLWVLGVSR